MTGVVAFLGVAAAIFAAELGDKTQLFVMGLSAKGKPGKDVLGMSISIILLNIIAVFLGVALSDLINPGLIKLAAGFAFLIFAYLSLSDEAEAGEEKKVGKFVILSIATMFFLAELGDKTQLSVIALSAREPQIKLWIFSGATVGMLLADGVGVLLGAKIGRKIPKKIFSRIAFMLFLVFGIASVGESIDLLFPGRAIIPTVIIALVYIIIIFLGRKPARA